MKSQPQSAKEHDFGRTERRSVSSTVALSEAAPTKSAFTAPTRPGEYEVLTSTELASRLKVKVSWIVDQSKRSRTSDPIPVFRLGKHRRYRWGSPEMDAWLDRRARFDTQQRKAEPKRKEER